MITINKTITISGYSTHDGATIATYSATIDYNNPAGVAPSSYIQDAALYRAHREECNKERTQFEDVVFTLQEEATAEKETVDTQKAAEHGDA